MLKDKFHNFIRIFLRINKKEYREIKLICFRRQWSIETFILRKILNFVNSGMSCNPINAWSQRKMDSGSLYTAAIELFRLNIRLTPGPMFNIKVRNKKLTLGFKETCYMFLDSPLQNWPVKVIYVLASHAILHMRTCVWKLLLPN